MISRAVFVSAQLCFIIQVAFILSALGLDGQSYGSSSPIQEQMLLKRSIQSQGLLKLDSVPELYNLTLLESIIGITAKWSLKDPTSFPNLRFRVTTAGVDKIVSQDSYNISGLACKTSYDVKVSPVDAAGADYGVSTKATIITKGVPELVNITIEEIINGVTVRWSLKDPQCFPDLRFRCITKEISAIVSNNSCHVFGFDCNTNSSVWVSAMDAYNDPYGSGKTTFFIMLGVPEVYPLILSSRDDVIEAKWSLKGKQCLPGGVRFRVTTAGVDKIVNGTSFKISGVRTCNISYNVNVSPVYANGTSNGFSASATVISAGVPQLFNLTLTEASNEITVKWSLKDPKCYPNVRFRVTTAGVDKLVLQNSLKIRGIACKTSYFVKVSPVDLNNITCGDSINATILAKGVLEVGNLVLSSTLKEISAKWSLYNAKCFPNVWFRVTTAGVDKIVAQNSYDISGLACNTRYNVQVSPVNYTGAPYGVSTNATIITKGVTSVPEVIDLILKATSNEITARWALRDPACFPNVKFRVTSVGVNKIVSQNSSVISGLACDTRYVVKVSAIDGTGADSGFARETSIITLGVQVTLRAMVAESLIVKWAPVQGSCNTFSSYEVTLSLANGAYQKTSFTPNTHVVFARLTSSTAYRVQVQPLDARGRGIGRAVMAQETTLHIDTAAGRCPYPTLVIAVWQSAILCARVETPTPSTNLEANKVCYNKYPPTAEFQYMAVMYLVANGWAKFEYLQEYLRMFDYTGKFLVNGYYKNGTWVWGFGTNYDATFPIDPALVSGLPKGGVGPNDNKMLYIDSANNFTLKAAIDGYPFDAMICAFPLKV